MWEHISSIDFRDKTVVDIGCGHGDISRRVFDAGVSSLVSIDNVGVILDEAIKNVFGSKRFNIETSRKFKPYHVSFDDFLSFNTDVFDIAICLSVLPYFPAGIPASLQSISSICKTAIFECQYYGDGPGPEELHDYQDFKKMLMNNGFYDVELIGYSTVLSRGLTRDIIYVKSDMGAV